MSTNVPRRLLIVSSIDHDRVPQSSDLARAAWYVASGAQVTLLYRALNYGRRWHDVLRDSLTLRITRRSVDGVDLWRVDPPLNYCAGLGQAPRKTSSAPARPRLRATVGGVLRDLCAWPTLTLVALLRLRGCCDVALGSGPYGGLVAWMLCRLGRARQFVYLDRDYEPGLLQPGLRRRLLAALEPFLVRRAAVVTSVGRRLSRLRRRQTGREPVLLPNGVDFERFAPARQRTARCCNLMYIGALFPHSGLAAVLEALPRVRDVLPATRLIIVGTGPDEDRLRGLVAQRHLLNAVDFRGPQPYGELPRMLAQADVGLAIAERSAFRRYACPLKLLEYAAAGVPALATVGTEAGDMVRRHGCGLAVPHTPAALADALLHLLSSASLYADLQAGALAFAAEHTWHRILAREAELIRAALGVEAPAPRAPVAPAEARI